MLRGAAKSASKSPSLSIPSLSNLRSQQGKIPPTGPEGRKSGTHPEDGRLQPVAEFGLSICDLGKRPAIFGVTTTRTKVRKGALSRKDVKNEGRSDYVHENKA
jgi:hypothetical protein